MATLASTVDATMPAAGVPRPDSRPNAGGNSPSLAAANGISAQIMVQPFSAPMPETMTASAIRSPAQVPPPAMVFAASVYDAPFSGFASSAVGTTPKTAISDSM